MRNPNRIEPFLEKFKELWLKHPDLRFGQLVYILQKKQHKTDVGDIFFPEDDVWLKCIEEYMRESSK